MDEPTGDMDDWDLGFRVTGIESGRLRHITMNLSRTQLDDRDADDIDLSAQYREANK